jgi:hypothetical protein
MGTSFASRSQGRFLLCSKGGAGIATLVPRCRCAGSDTNAFGTPHSGAAVAHRGVRLDQNFISAPSRQFGSFRLISVRPALNDSVLLASGSGRADGRAMCAPR